MFRVGIATALAVLIQGIDPQQDWELMRTGDQTLAALSYDSGLALGVRCSDGVLSVVAAGLPPGEDYRRQLSMRVDHSDTVGEVQSHDWFVGSDPTMAFHPFPSVVARGFRRGGRLRLTVPNADPNGRAMVYLIDLPPSQVAIDEVLTACEKPLVDPLDREVSELNLDGLPGRLSWSRDPVAQHPGMTDTTGFVNLVCLAHSNGEVDGCRIETEYPTGWGYGRAALLGMRGARVSMSADHPATPVVIAVPFTFSVGERETVDTLQRRPRRPPR